MPQRLVFLLFPFIKLSLRVSGWENTVEFFGVYSAVRGKEEVGCVPSLRLLRPNLIELSATLPRIAYYGLNARSVHFFSGR